MSPSWTSSAWCAIERYAGMVDDPDAFLGKLLPILLSKKTKIPRFLVLALMPTRGYFRIDNPGEDLTAYRTRCLSVINQCLRPLIDIPERLKDFYQRRISAIEEFLRKSQVKTLVVGRHDDHVGHNTFNTEQFDQFVEHLKAALGIDVQIV